MQHHRLYSVITKHDWLTNEPIEAMVVATARLDSTLDEIRSRVPRSTGYLAVVSGLTLSEAGRIERGPMSQTPRGRFEHENRPMSPKSSRASAAHPHRGS